MDRDPVLERQAILNAARSAGFDGEQLADLALTRAGNGPITDPGERDFGWEAIEEASDGLNYGTFCLLLTYTLRDCQERDLAVLEVAEMLRAFASAYYHAQRLRYFMREAA